MKKRSYIATVVKKECTDILRDRKTLLINLLLPLALYPIMFLFMGNAMTGMMDRAENQTRVALSESGALRSFLEAGNALIVDTDAPVEALQNGEADVALESAPLPSGQTEIRVIFDDKKSDSSFSADFVNSLLQAYNEVQVRETLQKQGIDLDALYPVSVQTETLSIAMGETDSGSAGMMLTMLIPMLLVVFLAMGGMAIAGDLFAGEKERKTMEPLLCTRAGRGSILTGKYIVVTLFSLITMAASILGMVLGYLVNPRAMGMGLDDSTGFVMPVGALLLTVALIVLMAMVFAGLHVAIATYARSVKEASMYGTFLMLVSYIPSFGCMFMQAGDFADWMMLVPVLNVTGSIKMILGGMTNYGFLFGSIAVSLVFLGLTLALTKQLFKRESIMLRTM